MGLWICTLNAGWKSGGAGVRLHRGWVTVELLIGDGRGGGMLCVFRKGCKGVRIVEEAKFYYHLPRSDRAL